MAKLLHCATLVTVAALLACSNSTPTPAPATTPEPTATGGIAPLRLDDPEAFLAELSDAERSCISEDSDPQGLVDLKGSPHLASPELIQCLEDETLMRLFLTEVTREAGTLSEERSMCIRAGFSGIDLQSVMLASATGGDELAALADHMTSSFLALSCLDDGDWEAVIGTAAGERERELERQQCLLEELGGPERLAAAMIPTERGEADPDPALLAAVSKCDQRSSPGG